MFFQQINGFISLASKNSGTTRYFVNGKLVYTYSTNLNLGADNNGDISIGSINTTVLIGMVIYLILE